MHQARDCQRPRDLSKNQVQSRYNSWKCFLLQKKSLFCSKRTGIAKGKKIQLLTPTTELYSEAQSTGTLKPIKPR